MKIETPTISVAITKAEREKKDGSPALIKEESHKSKKYHDPIIKKEAEEGDNDSGNDNDNGDITDGPPDEEEGELVSDAIAKEISSNALTLYTYELSLLENDTHPELLEALEEAANARDKKIEIATKRYQLEKERIARTFEAMRAANLSELRSVEMDIFEAFYKQSFLSIRRKLSSRSRNAAKSTQAVNGNNAAKQQSPPNEVIATSQV
ncbi:hypothetical protein MDAP_002430 [Mitosporidium daphniae]